MASLLCSSPLLHKPLRCGFIHNKEFKEIAGKWGVGKDGTSQLLEHTIGKDIDRISEIAKRVGINPTELTDMFGQDAIKRMAAIKKFDRMSDDLISKATMKNTNLEGGIKEAYYFPAVTKPGEGVIVLRYDGKKDTMMPGDRGYFDNHFGVKK